MNQSSNAKDQGNQEVPPTRNGESPADQAEPTLTGSDYEFAEPQLGVAEISEDVAESADLKAAAAEAARVEHEAELVAQDVSSPKIAPASEPLEPDDTESAAPIDWDSSETIMRTDFSQPPVANNPWSQNEPPVTPEVPDLPPVPAVPPTGSQELGEPAPEALQHQPSQDQHDVGATAAHSVPPSAPEAAPRAGVDHGHGWRRPETPWQQSATPWQPKAGQWQSPAQLARGEAEAAAAAQAAGASEPSAPPHEAPTTQVPTLSGQEQAPSSGEPQAHPGATAPLVQPSTPGGQGPYGAPTQHGAPGPAPYGNAQQQRGPQFGAPQQGGSQQGGSQQGGSQQGAAQYGGGGQPGVPGVPPVPGYPGGQQGQQGQPNAYGQPNGAGYPSGPQNPNGPNYPGGPQGPTGPGYPNGPQGPTGPPSGGGMSGPGKKKLFIILGVAAIGLGLIAFFIWLLASFIFGNANNDRPVPAASEQSQQQQSQSPQPSEETSPEDSSDDGLIIAELSPLDWLESDCLRDFQDQSTAADVVLCSTAHNAQLVGTYNYADDDEFPGVEALKAKAAEVCDGVEFTSEASGIETLKQTTAYPSESTWNDKDDRRVDCMVHDTRSGNLLETSLIK